MKIEREQVILSLLDTISGVADKEYQQRVWVRGEGPECDDFGETVCNFFGDGDPILEHYKEYGLTEEQYHVLKTFRDEFEIFANDYTEAFEFVDSPEWAVIVEKAKGVLKAFNYKKS